MFRYVYHYHAFRQTLSNTFCHIDGLITCESPVNSFERYEMVKVQIAEASLGRKPTTEEAQSFIIDSLTFLHAVESAPNLFAPTGEPR